MVSHKWVEELPQRKSPRAKHHNYGWSAWYLVTIVSKGREQFFEIPALRTIVEATWQALPGRFPSLTPDEFVVMPDHIHFILHLEGNVKQPTTLGCVVGAYKSLISHDWLAHLKETGFTGIYPGQIWQRNYNDRIIHTQQELEQKRFYVRNNPLKLLEDLTI